MSRAARWIAASIAALVLCLTIAVLARGRDDFSFLTALHPRRVEAPVSKRGGRYESYILVFSISERQAVLRSMRATLPGKGFAEGFYPTEDDFTKPEERTCADFISGPYEFFNHFTISKSECAVHVVRQTSWFERQTASIEHRLGLD